MSAPRIDARAALLAAGVLDGDALDLAQTLESCAGYLTRATPPKPVWARLLQDLAKQVRPKPEEPQGLGAVVEDADEEWVHFGNGCWIKSVPNAQLRQTSWRQFSNAVRVLSEGVAR